MDYLKERELRYANDTINQARRDIAALGAFGYVPTKAQPIIEQYGGTVRKLNDNQNQIAALRPEPGQDHEKALTELLKEEAYLAETIISLSLAAAEAVGLERIAFFEEREQRIQPYLDEQARADEQAQTAIRDLAAAMQKRFRAMNGEYDLRHFLNDISSNYSAAEFRLPKPFSKSIKHTWGSFAAVYLERIGDVFASRETTAPADIASEVFRR